MKEKAAAAKAQEAAKAAEQSAQKTGERQPNPEKPKDPPGEPVEAEDAPLSSESRIEGKESDAERLILHTIDKTDHEKQVHLFS